MFHTDFALVGSRGPAAAVLFAQGPAVWLSGWRPGQVPQQEQEQVQEQEQDPSNVSNQGQDQKWIYKGSLVPKITLCGCQRRNPEGGPFAPPPLVDRGFMDQA